VAEGYGEDVAYVHEQGHGAFAQTAAPWIVRQLRANGFRDGLVIDLGCGPGHFAAAATAAGFEVLGIDSSGPMIGRARARAPRATFRTASLFDTPLPPCVAVTALGECVNYRFDSGNNARSLGRLFRRVWNALAPGGLFIFDVAGPGRAGPSGASSAFRMGGDWVVLATTTEDRRARQLTRRVTTFRRIGASYRRREEVHRLRLYRRANVKRLLRNAGFRVRWVRGFGVQDFPTGLTGFVAKKGRTERFEERF
jgi:SAM-dependent methyltransferase